MSTLPVRQKLIEIARREVGVREVGRNTGKRVREYQAATNLEGTAGAFSNGVRTRRCWQR